MVVLAPLSFSSLFGIGLSQKVKMYTFKVVLAPFLRFSLYEIGLSKKVNYKNPR
jgi:hypothetical protein